MEGGSRFILVIKGVGITVTDVLRVIVVILTNNEKNLSFFYLNFLYNFIVTLQSKNQFVKYRRNKFIKTTQRKSDRFFQIDVLLNKNKFLKHYDQIYVFDKTFVQVTFLKRYSEEN